MGSEGKKGRSLKLMAASLPSILPAASGSRAIQHVARAHAAKPPCHTHVNSAVHSGDSYKTENADDRKAKSRDTCTTNCEAGTRERDQLFILALPCRCRHPSLGFMYLSFSPRLLLFHSFLHKHNTCSPHSGHLRTDNAYGCA